MDNIYKLIFEATASGEIDKKIAVKILKSLKNEGIKETDDIAIIGMAARLPMCENLDDFWDIISNGLDCITPFPENRKKDIDDYIYYSRKHQTDEDTVKYQEGAYLKEIDKFDHEFFNLSLKEAELIDPCQRIFLETVYHAIEDAGYAGKKLTGSKTGVYVGFASNVKDNYGRIIIDTAPESVQSSLVGNISAVMPARISYLLDLKGPSMVIDTACSSSLAAIHYACQSIKNGDCDMAIAGGVKIHLLPLATDNFSLGVESSDYRTRAFDKLADGTGIGDGVGVVLLKPLKKAIKDKDNIYAVIKGSAINQDGKSIGITAPTPSAQRDVLVKAWENSGINPETLSYIEAHGTATKLGDPIEIEGLERAFREYTDKKQFCALSSVKTNIGHLYECAGIIGLIKAVMALKRKMIPRTINFNIPNSKIDFAQSPIYINNRMREWKAGDTPRRCGVSAFGLSGTNSHVVLEEFDEKLISTETSHIEADKYYIFTLSANKKETLKKYIHVYKSFFTKNSGLDLEKVCYSANTGRKHFRYRIAVIAKNYEDLTEKFKLLESFQWDEKSEEWFCYGEHKIVTQDKAFREPGEITEKERIELSKSVIDKLCELGSASKGVYLRILVEVCSLYVKGADIKWSDFYGEQIYNKISLPTYPFERKRCWIKIPRIYKSTEKEQNADSFYYGVKWCREDVTYKNENDGIIVVFISPNHQNRGNEIISRIRNQGREVIEVELSECFKKIHAHKYAVKTSLEDFEKLFKEIEDRNITHLVYINLSYENIKDCEGLEEALTKSVYSLFYLVKAVAKSFTDKLKLVLIASNAYKVTGKEKSIYPENAALIGLGRVVSQEFPNLICKGIDVDDVTGSDDIADGVFIESKSYLSAYRNGIRYVEEFTGVDIHSLPFQKTEIKAEGIYIVTGGAGGIGIEITKHLASKGKINVALINRSELPNRKSWSEFLSQSEDKKVCAKIKGIIEIEAVGATVEYCKADVANKEEMSAVLTSLREKYGKINGIIHAAGIAGSGYMLRKDIQDFERVISPKITGAWLLDRLTDQDNLDFFVLFSSGVSIIGEAGQGDYVAANSYLDSFCEYRSLKGKKTQTINWVAWQNAGMAVEYGINTDSIFKAIPTDVGVRAFEEILNHDVSRLLVGQLNYNMKDLIFSDKLPIRLSDKIQEPEKSVENDSTRRVIENNGYEIAVIEDDRVTLLPRSQRKKNEDCNSHNSSSDIILKGKGNKEYSQVEYEVAKIYSEVLGLEEVDIYDSFFELGGDSILLTRMHRIIEKQFPKELKLADLFAYTSVYSLSKYITESIKQDIKEVSPISRNTQMGSSNDNRIAIIGMAARLPGGMDIEGFWEAIVNGIDCITEIPDQRKEDALKYIKFTGDYLNPSGKEVNFSKGSYIEDIDKFDYEFFKVTPKEAELMDPFQRLFLQNAYHAIEDAGYGGRKLSGSRTAVFVGYATNLRDSYQKMIYDVNPSDIQMSMSGNFAAHLSARISYFLDLKGPTMVLDTACSSSLVAVHLACQSIRNGECEMAIAGGVRINLLPVENEYIKLGTESSDYCTRAFDDSSDGAGTGEGIVALLLKPLKAAERDGDNIYAVIKGSAVNQDGSSIGITAPNPASQEDVIVRAWKESGTEPETLSYIEAHGTGTKLGDPIEVEGIQRAFTRFTDKKQFCALVSTKTNIGHLNECAGIMGLMKAVLALKHRVIPPSVHFEKPNKKIDFEQSPVYINTRARQWEATALPRRCGVSSFGLSGTNCHLVLEEYNSIQANTDEIKESADFYILPISAVNKSTLQEFVKSYLEFIQRENNLDLEDICYSAATGRGHYGARIIVIANNRDELVEKLKIIVDKWPDGFNQPGVYFGIHKIVSENKEHKGKGELTRGEKALLDDKACIGLDSIVDKEGDERYGLLEEIGDLYVNGADIEWERIYFGKNPKRVSIPLYPFAQKRCWIRIPDIEEIIDEDFGMYYTVVWEQEDLSDIKDKENQGAVLVFKTEEGIGEEISIALRKEGRLVIEVSISDKYCKISEFTYSIRAVEEDYAKLINDTIDIRFTTIIHTLALCGDKEIENIEQLEESKRLGVYSLFHLVKAMAKRYNEKVDIVLISNYVNEVTGEEDITNPQWAPLFGLGRVIDKEYTQLNCRSIDTDNYTSLNHIITEINNGNEITVSYRKGIRYIEKLDEIEVLPDHSKPIEIRQDGIYIISGGAGGIGLEVADYLTSKGNLNIAFLNRSEIPQREQWDEILHKGEDEKLCKTLEKIKKIEAAGAKIEYLSVDISDFKSMKQLMENLRQKYGRINGVIHGAGVGESGIILNRSEEDLRRVLSPKVDGTWILDKVTSEDNLDFFIMFSSVATVFNAVTQGDYTAANAFMDSHGAYRNKKGRKTLVINWTTWKETGMAYESGVMVEAIFKALLTKDAISSFDEVFRSSVKRVLIGRLNIDGGGLFLLENSGIRLSEGILRKVDKNKEYIAKSKVKVHKEIQPSEIRFSGKGNEQYTRTEMDLAVICRDVLGLEDINIYDNFFEMGADSILLSNIHSRIENMYPGKTVLTDLFEYPSIAKLAQYISGKETLKESSDTDTNGKNARMNDEIAIIGMKFAVGGADNVEDLWRIVSVGSDCIGCVSEERKDDINRYLKFKGIPLSQINYVNGTYLEDIDKFDYGYFKMSPSEAKLTDPNQRLLLETAFHAIEDAGYAGERIKGSNTGVFIGYSINIRDLYSRIIYDIDPSMIPISLVGNTTAVLPGRISYMLNLKGPSMVVDTACSSSLVAVDVACQSLRNGTCDMAIAGGIKLSIMPVTLKNELMNIGFEASDGRTRAFDDESDGTGLGEGVGVVLLKPLSKALEDGDNIYAVIKGSASNQDGSSAGITAPNPTAQEEVIIQAWKKANIDPETISYIEAHGTGTKLGDPIEIKGIQNAFRRYTDKKQFCAVSTIKTNIGHLSEGAGILGLIKAVLSLKFKRLPPSVNFNKPNSRIEFTQSPIYINTRLRYWDTKGNPRRCGVSSFGMSGTNCHVILEEFTGNEYYTKPVEESCLYILTLSAKTENTLIQLIKNYSNYLNKNTEIDLGRICYTANTGREHHNFRLAMVVEDMDELRQKLKKIAESGNLCIADRYVAAGKHKIALEVQGVNSPEEITEKDRADLSVMAEYKLTEYMKSRENNKELLKELCDLYVKGADINWKQLYKDKKFEKVSLPLYPFERRRCWVDITEVSAQIEEDIALEDDSEGLYYGIKWKELVSSENITKDLKHDTILIFKDEKMIGSSLAYSLRQEGKNVIEIDFKDKDTENEKSNYTVDGTLKDYERLVEELQQSGDILVIHMLSISNSHEIDDINQLQESQKKGIYSLFYMVKAFLHFGKFKKIDFVLISDYVNDVTGREENIKPQNAPLFGLGKVIWQEYSEIGCRCIDVDGFTSTDEILKELKTTCKAYLVAYREGKRYVEEFTELNMDDIYSIPAEIKDVGVYIITGGTGGIGISMAQYLASKNNVNIALINRSAFPERKQWDRILQENRDEHLCRTINIIRDIEAKGSGIELISADVSDFMTIKDIIDRLRKKYSRINGIIHSAGIAGEGFLIRKDEAVFSEVLLPKIYGTWILDTVTKDDRLDFFVMCSSMASIFSSAGQGDYVGANAYMDSFAAYRNRTGRRSLCIDWVTWKETGMGVRFGINIDTLFKAITTNKALEGFERVIGSEISRILIGEMNYSSDQLQLIENIPLDLSESIMNKVKRSIENQKAISAKVNHKKGYSSISKISLKGKDNDNYTQFEKLLAQIWGDILGLSEINIYDNLFELGGDSILAVRIANSINEAAEKNIGVAEILKYPVFKNFVEYVEGTEIEDESNSTDNKDIPSCITVVEERDFYPLSSFQKGLYLLNRIDGISTSYNVPDVSIITGPIDPKRVEDTMLSLIDRHESLRTSFEIIDNEPVQKIHENVDFSIIYEEMDEKDAVERAEEIFRDFVRPFDLSIAPLFRMKLIKLSDDKHILMYDIHHIIADGISISILAGEFSKLYQGESLTPLKLRYRDYAVWQNELLRTDFMKRQEEFWIRKFSGEIPELDMPVDYRRPHVKSYEGSHFTFELDSELTNGLKRIVTGAGYTMYMLLLTVLNTLLWKYSRQEDIIIGSPTAGRYHSDLDNVMGMFVNTIAIRNFPTGEKNFMQFLEEVGKNVLEAYENQHYPFEKLIENLKPRRNLSRSPLFDVLFVLQNFEPAKLRVDSLDYWTARVEEVITNSASKFDITLTAVEIDERIVFDVEYCTKLFKPSKIKRFAQHYINIVKDVVMNPGKKLYEIEILDGEEKERIINEFNDTSSDYNRAELICSLFKDQVARTPDNIAISSWDDKLTYRELDRRSNELAGLLRQKGITRETVVGIMLERSSAMIVAILGVLKAGGAYLPIDPAYPNERISFMLEDSHARILLSTRKLMDKVSFERFEGEWLDMEAVTDSMGEEIDCYDVNKPEDAAYIIYTSGTTGKPKGVVVEHRNLIAYVNAFRKEFALSQEDVMLQQASFSFDAFIEEVYPVLTSGGKLVIPERQSILDIEKLVEIMREEGTTIMSCSPLLLNELNKHSAVESMKVYISGGDVLKWEHISNLIKRAKVYNTYGPTESTVCATYYRCDESSYEVSIPIGKPIANYKVYIMDKYMNLMPVGVPGELCIAGEGVARGYLGMERLTEEKFVQSPFDANERIYRTGDLAKWWEDGNIEFLGRIDSQVKIRGYRIELGEIERQLKDHYLVQDAVVIDREDAERGKYLCAYFVTSEKLTLQDLKAHLLKELPEYMIPSYFIQIDSIPRTTSGKLDRNSLPEPVESIDTGVDYVAPKGMKEERLAEVWQEVLGIEKIGVNDNFFDLGGNSIKAIQVVSKLNTEYIIAVNQIFEHQTIRNLAANIVYNKDNLKNMIESAKELVAVTGENEVISIEDYSEVQEKLERYKQLNKRYESTDLSVVKRYENILLTGSTGYLGIYLAKELLETTSSGIYLPVRAENQKEAEERFLGKLRFYFDDGLYEEYRGRIHVFNGDLSADRLGLEKEEYMELCEKIDCVINSAANVRHYGRYSEFEKINVLGTQKMVELCKTGNIKDYNHISTISVGWGYIEGKDYEVFTEYDCDIGQNTNSYYEKSKIEAEKLILKAREEGLNVNIFRPGNLAFNSETGKFQENISENNFYRMLKSVLKLGVVPDIKNITLDFSYIDYVSKAIVLLFDKTKLINENHHIFNSQSTDMLELADIIRGLGYKINKIKFIDFMDYLMRSYDNDTETVSNVLTSIMGNSPNTTKIDVMQDRTSIILGRLGMVWPKLNDELVRRMLDYCENVKFL